MAIDMLTVRSLELIQNLHQAKSKHCLLGHLNHTHTPMGARLVRSCILQPMIDLDVINTRLDALEELTNNEQIFHKLRQGAP